MSITCPNCGDINPDGTRFCVECGEYLAWDRSDRPEDVRRPQAAEPPPPEQHAEIAVGLSQRALSVTPGRQVSATVTVRNRGTRVEQVKVLVQGDAAQFASVEPAELVIPPGATAEGTLVLTPPRSSAVPAGTAGFTVLARSLVNEGVSAVADGSCAVSGFDDLSVELSPKTARGRWRTRHKIALISRGNLAHRTRLNATDAANALRFSLPEADVLIDPGRTELPLRVSARPSLTGEPREVPFSVVASMDHGEVSIHAEGTRTILPVFPPWALKAVIAVVSLALLAVVAIVAVNALREEPKQAAPPPPTREPYAAGDGTLSGGYASVQAPGLTDDSKIFVTPDLTGAALPTTETGQPRTRDLRPAGSLGVTGRGDDSFSVQTVDGSGVEGIRFGYLVVKKPRGTIGGLPYEAGSGTIAPGENRLDVPAETATGGSVILLTVETTEPLDSTITGLRVDAKSDGAFRVATLDLAPVPRDISFNWLVIDSGDPSLAGVNTTTAVAPNGDPVRIRSPLADGSGIVLLTTDATQDELSAVAMTGVCVGDQGDGAFTVEWFTDRITYLPTDFDYLIVRRRG